MHLSHSRSPQKTPLCRGRHGCCICLLCSHLITKLQRYLLALCRQTQVSGLPQCPPLAMHVSPSFSENNKLFSSTHHLLHSFGVGCDTQLTSENIRNRLCYSVGSFWNLPLVHNIGTSVSNKHCTMCCSPGHSQCMFVSCCVDTHQSAGE